MVQKFRESFQISVKVNFHDKNFVITLNFLIQCCPAHFSASGLYRPPRDIHSNCFVNKIFVISRLITKFTKILCHKNLEQYGNCLKNDKVCSPVLVMLHVTYVLWHHTNRRVWSAHVLASYPGMVRIQGYTCLLNGYMQDTLVYLLVYQASLSLTL